MPNGNIIYIGWERITVDEQIAYGRKPSQISQPHLWGEFIQEIRPIGDSDYEVVWEWHLQDHFVQDYDSTLPNYGTIKDEIGKVDINYLGPAHFNDDDWWHCNALDYNPTLDQILLNSRSNGELWIVDHSTSTLEAAGNTGGNSAKGGELLFRWGNPAAYNSGFYFDLRMYGSHGHYWIPEGLPNAGKIMYFNNGDERPEGYYSTVEMIETQFENGQYLKNDNNRYFPLEPEIVYKAPNPSDFMSTYLSNAQQLANGNVFINEGGRGRLFEIDSHDNIVWQYNSPVDYSGPNTQGENISYWNTQIFRAYKYAPDYPGLQGVDLTPGELLEGDSQYNLCKDVSVDDSNFIEGLSLIYDFSSSILTIDNNSLDDLTLQIVNLEGKLLSREKIKERNSEADLGHLEAGLYVVIVTTSDGKRSVRKKVVKI